MLVGRITEKLLNKLLQNLVEGSDMGQEGTHNVLAQIQDHIL